MNLIRIILLLLLSVFIFYVWLILIDISLGDIKPLDALILSLIVTFVVMTLFVFEMNITGFLLMFLFMALFGLILWISGRYRKSEKR